MRRLKKAFERYEFEETSRCMIEKWIEEPNTVQWSPLCLVLPCLQLYFLRFSKPQASLKPSYHIWILMQISHESRGLYTFGVDDPRQEHSLIKILYYVTWFM